MINYMACIILFETLFPLFSSEQFVNTICRYEFLSLFTLSCMIMYRCTYYYVCCRFLSLEIRASLKIVSIWRKGQNTRGEKRRNVRKHNFGDRDSGTWSLTECDPSGLAGCIYCCTYQPPHSSHLPPPPGRWLPSSSSAWLGRRGVGSIPDQ